MCKRHSVNVYNNNLIYKDYLMNRYIILYSYVYYDVVTFKCEPLEMIEETCVLKEWVAKMCDLYIYIYSIVENVTIMALVRMNFSLELVKI